MKYLDLRMKIMYFSGSASTRSGMLSKAEQSYLFEARDNLTGSSQRKQHALTVIIVSDD